MDLKRILLGSYPTQKDKRQKPQEKYVCTFNSFTQQSVWVYEDERDKQVVPLECTNGCLPAEELNFKVENGYNNNFNADSINCSFSKLVLKLETILFSEKNCKRRSNPKGS